MKLKAQQVMDATEVVAKIIREKRPMPLKGAYRLARLHAKLLPEYTTLNERRNAMITAYDHHAVVVESVDPYKAVPSETFSVPPDKMPEFEAAWKEIGDTEIEVEVEPVPLSTLDLGDSVSASISANELIVLGDLVRE